MRSIIDIFVDKGVNQIQIGKKVTDEQADAFEKKKIQQQALKEQEEARKAQKKSQG